MKIKRISETAKTEVTMEGASRAFKQVPLSKDDGTPAYSFRVFTLQPEGHTPFHHHPYEHLNYVIEGDGYIRTEAGEPLPLKKGDFVLVDPGEKHQYGNASKATDFVMICSVPKEFE